MKTYTREEQAEHRAALVAALRSGDFIQTHGKLRKDRSGVSSYCCLGVGCELYRRARQDHGSSGRWRQLTGTHYADVFFFAGEGRGQSAHLPVEVAEYYGFYNASGVLTELGVRTAGFASLISMNDGGASFLTIADAIENGLVQLRGQPR